MTRLRIPSWVLAGALLLAGLPGWPGWWGVAAAEEEDATEWRVVLNTTGVSTLGRDGQTSDSQQQGVRVQASGSPLDWLNYQIDYVQNVNSGTGIALAAQANALAAALDQDLPLAGAALFRFKSGRQYLEVPTCVDSSDLGSCERVAWYHEIDRAYLKLKTGPLDSQVGRFPISWGAGRIWRPTDLFAAFSPLTLDTEFRPGVDGLRASIFPSDFSSVTFAYIISPEEEEPRVDNSPALQYRTTVGDVSEITLVAGNVRGKQLFGGSFETAFWKAGWLLEALAFEPVAGEPMQTFAVAGMNRSLTSSITLLAELYYNSLGATTEDEASTFAALAVDPSPDQDLAAALAAARQEGRMPQLARNLAGFGLQGSFGGLWSGGYNLLVSALGDADGQSKFSYLHQAALSYSISDEAGATFALLAGGGGESSEFGNLPSTFVFSVKFTL